MLAAFCISAQSQTYLPTISNIFAHNLNHICPHFQPHLLTISNIFALKSFSTIFAHFLNHICPHSQPHLPSLSTIFAHFLNHIFPVSQSHTYSLSRSTAIQSQHEYHQIFKAATMLQSFLLLFYMHACTLQSRKKFLWQLSLSLMVFGQNSKTLGTRILSFGTKSCYKSVMFSLFPTPTVRMSKISDCRMQNACWPSIPDRSIMCQWSGWWIEHPDSPPSVRAEETSRLWCTASAAAVCVAREGKGRVIWAAPRVHGFTYIKSPTRP